MSTRENLAWLARVLVCAVAAAIMLGMKPRAALAYSSYEIPCSYTGHITTSPTSLPSGQFDEYNCYSMSFTYEMDYPRENQWNNSTYGYNSPLTMVFNPDSSTALYNGYLYGTIVMTFGGRNVAIGNMYKNLEVFWPRSLDRYLYYFEYDSGNSRNSIGVKELLLVPTSYGWYGRTADESSDSWHTGSITDYKNAARLYAVGLVFRTDEQIQTDAMSSTSSGVSQNRRYWLSLLEKPVMLGYVEDTDMINALQDLKTGLATSFQVRTDEVITSIDSSAEDTQATITQQTQQQTNALKDTTGSGSVLSNLTQGGTTDFDSKIGLLGQLSTVTDTYMGALEASPNGTVHFPGITVLGQAILQPADINVWSNGLSEWREPCRVIVTFGFIVAWVNGMKRVLDYQILGQPYDGTDEP